MPRPHLVSSLNTSPALNSSLFFTLLLLNPTLITPHSSVSGSIFASPTASQIFSAIRLCQPSPSSSHPSPGTLIICGNYTGDILNAGLAITRATAAGYKVRFIPVGDDVAVGRKKGGKVGRRGLSAHVVGLKTVCALAERGLGLDKIGEIMGYIASNCGTIAVAFDR